MHIVKQTHATYLLAIQKYMAWDQENLEMWYAYRGSNGISNKNAQWLSRHSAKAHYPQNIKFNTVIDIIK